MLLTPKVHVIGMRPGSLAVDGRDRDILHAAKVVAGGKRLLAACALASDPERPFSPEKQIPITGPLDGVIRKIKGCMNKGVVVLADGDPLFFGFARRLMDELGPDQVVVHPNLTTVQLACAKLKTPWHSLPVISLHGRDDHGPLLAELMRAGKVAVYTDRENDPPAIARLLMEKDPHGFTMTVLEDLDTPQERIRTLDLHDVWDAEFSPLNLVVVQRAYPPEVPLHLGVPDHFYEHENNLITKQAARSAGLGMLGILPDSVVWDLGAGSGSMAIEASHLACRGRVYAVERHPRRVACVRENVRRFGALLVEVVRGEMPRALKRLPDPDRVFIGGGLGGDWEQGKKILKAATSRLKPGGRLVAHCILLETLARAREFLDGLGWKYGVVQLQASTSEPLADDLRFKAQNPVFALWTERPGPREAE